MLNKRKIFAAAMLLSGVVSASAQEPSSAGGTSAIDTVNIGEALARRIHFPGDSLPALLTITEFAILYPLGRGADVITRVGVAMGTELGGLHRVGRNDALGITAFGFMGNDDARVGGKLRYRHWLSRQVALDVGVGGVVAHDSQERADEYVGSLGLSLDDRLHLVIHYENYRMSESGYTSSYGSINPDNATHRASDLFVGLKLGREGGVAATATALFMIPALFDMGGSF